MDPFSNIFDEYSKNLQIEMILCIEINIDNEKDIVEIIKNYHHRGIDETKRTKLRYYCTTAKYVKQLNTMDVP